MLEALENTYIEGVRINEAGLIEVIPKISCDLENLKYMRHIISLYVRCC